MKVSSYLSHCGWGGGIKWHKALQATNNYNCTQFQMIVGSVLCSGTQYWRLCDSGAWSADLPITSPLPEPLANYLNGTTALHIETGQ